MKRIAIASALLLVAMLFAPSWFLPYSHEPPIGYRKIDVTLFEVQELRKRVHQFKEQTGALPSSEIGLRALLTSRPTLLEIVPSDAWGNHFVYKRDLSEEGFSLYSIGVNGVDEDGAGEDITGPGKVYSCGEYKVDCPLSAKDVLRWGLAACALAALLALLVSCGVLVHCEVRRDAA